MQSTATKTRTPTNYYSAVEPNTKHKFKKKKGNENNNNNKGGATAFLLGYITRSIVEYWHSSSKSQNLAANRTRKNTWNEISKATSDKKKAEDLRKRVLQHKRKWPALSNAVLASLVVLWSYRDTVMKVQCKKRISNSVKYFHFLFSFIYVWPRSFGFCCQRRAQESKAMTKDGLHCAHRSLIFLTNTVHFLRQTKWKIRPKFKQEMNSRLGVDSK